MDLADESGEIRCTAFKEQCDKFYDMIEVDKVYYITRCQLKSANKQYSSLKNDYEMTMTNDTEIAECTDGSCAVPETHYNFVQIHSIADIEDKAIIDVIGVAKSAGDVVHLKAKTTGRDLVKRDVTLVDRSDASVVLTLWGTDAEKFAVEEHPIVLLKGARVTEFGGGKTLGMIGGTVLKKNPDIEEAYGLRAWYDKTGGENAISVSSRNAAGGGSMQTEWLTFRESRDRNLGAGDKPDYFQTKAMVHNIRTGNAVYKACPNAECNKKVVDQDNGQFR
jgi:replication factor A1